MVPSRTALALILVASVVVASSGCSSQCAQVQEDWESWRSTSSPFTESANNEVHVGATFRVSALNKLLDQALSAKLDEALEFTDKISVASGKSIAVRTDGNVADLALFPDAACDTCLRVEGKLDGKLAVKIPLLGDQGVPLRGTFKLVAPVEFGKDDKGKGTVVLDLEKVAKLNSSRVTAEIAQLPPTWQDALESPLSGRILEAVGKSLGPVTLFTFEPLDLGVEGLEVLPATITTDAKKGLIFAGFHTNLKGVEKGLEPFVDLGTNETAGFVVHPGIVSSAITAMQRAEKLSETYDEDGKADKAGPFRAAMELVEATQFEDGATPGYDARFRLWKTGGKCYTATAKASGYATVVDDEVKIQIKDVELEESSMNGVTMAIANWAFLSRVNKVISTSLSAESVTIPGSEVSLSAARLRLHGPGLAISGKLVDQQ